MVTNRLRCLSQQRHQKGDEPLDKQMSNIWPLDVALWVVECRQKLVLHNRPGWISVFFRPDPWAPLPQAAFVHAMEMPVVDWVALEHAQTKQRL